MRKVYLLHTKSGVHLIASNFKAVYAALLDIPDTIDKSQFKSYGWYCFYLNNNQDVTIPMLDGNSFTISRRPLLSKYIGHLMPKICTIPNFKK